MERMGNIRSGHAASDNPNTDHDIDDNADDDDGGDGDGDNDADDVIVMVLNLSWSGFCHQSFMQDLRLSMAAQEQA